MEQTKQRIVVKVGTSTLTHESGALDLRSMEHLVRTLADLHGAGNDVILVRLEESQEWTRPRSPLERMGL